MGFFDRKSKENESAKEEKQVVIPEPWKCAKIISANEAYQKEKLPIGWYIFQEGKKWYALKPNPLSGELMRSNGYQFYPHRFEAWLGVPVPDVEAKTESRSDYEPLPTEDETPEPWECARIVSVDEVDDGDLPAGWYVYEYGGLWYALKPDPYDPQYMIESESADYPKDLEEWLGIPVAPPEPVEQPKRTDALDGRIIKSQETADARKQSEPPEYLKRMGLVEEDPMSKPPTDIENRWAEEQLTEQLKEAEAEIRDAEKILAADRRAAPATLEEDLKKKRKSLGRTNQVKTRLTDSELTEFNRRVKKSGLSQGEFIRNAILEGKIEVKEHDPIMIGVLDELALVRADLGRQGGLLKMITKPSAGMRSLHPEEWAELMQTIRDMEAIKQRLIELEVKISNGTCDTSKQ